MFHSDIRSELILARYLNELFDEFIEKINKKINKFKSYIKNKTDKTDNRYDKFKETYGLV